MYRGYLLERQLFSTKPSNCLGYRESRLANCNSPERRRSPRMNRRRTRQSGSAMVEFALIGIPVMFTLLITFELARAMWAYHTVAYAVKEGVRFAVVHGNDCA